MTCYDCIHCERCSDIEGGYSAIRSDVSKCKHFKPKSRFIELPCAVGDDIYWINPSTNKVECAKNDIKAVCYFGDGDFKIICQGANKPEDIGTTWCFLTKEEAEKALERSSNEKV